MAFDSIQVKFKNVTHFKSPLANTIEVPFVDSYLTVLKSVVSQIKTEYFWFLWINNLTQYLFCVQYINSIHGKTPFLKDDYYKNERVSIDIEGKNSI